MLKTLRDLFIPHQQNNHRPRILHLSSLYAFVTLIVFFQFTVTFVQNNYPGVLGFAADISPENIISLTNDERQKAGLGSLSSNSALSQGAMQKGADMFAKNYWAHFAPDGTSPWAFFKSVGYSYLYAGENLAKDFQNSGEVVSAWMNSPTHRDNIMNANYTEIGVAVINGTLSGAETTLVVQFFGKPSQSYVAQKPAVETRQPEVNIAESAPPTKTILPVDIVPSPAASPTATVKEDLENMAVLSPENTTLAQSKEKTAKSRFLGLSSFALSKAFSIVLLSLLIIMLIIDSVFMVIHKTVRIGGKNLVHISFLVIILLIILLTSAGRII